MSDFASQVSEKDHNEVSDFVPFEVSDFAKSVSEKVLFSGRDWPFFRSPPAFHRPLFMSPFAGDIGARAGSLKWIGQIRRKAYRWALRGDLKKILALNVKG